MVMWLFKSCPRCGGDMYIESDEDGTFKHCMLCSFRLELKAGMESKKEVILSAEEPVLAQAMS